MNKTYDPKAASLLKSRLLFVFGLDGAPCPIASDDRYIVEELRDGDSCDPFDDMIYMPRVRRMVDPKERHGFWLFEGSLDMLPAKCPDTAWVTCDGKPCDPIWTGSVRRVATSELESLMQMPNEYRFIEPTKSEDLGDPPFDSVANLPLDKSKQSSPKPYVSDLPGPLG